MTNRSPSEQNLRESRSSGDSRGCRRATINFAAAINTTPNQERLYKTDARRDIAAMTKKANPKKLMKVIRSRITEVNSVLDSVDAETSDRMWLEVFRPEMIELLKVLIKLDPERGQQVLDVMPDIAAELQTLHAPGNC